MNKVLKSDITKRLRKIESYQLTPELTEQRDYTKSMIDREIYNSLYPRFKSFDIWNQLTTFSDQSNDRDFALMAERIRALNDYTTQLQIDYLQKSDQLDLLYESYNLEINTRDSRDKFLKQYFSKFKFRRLFTLLSYSYGLKLDLDYFQKFIDEKSGCLEFRNLKFYAYHICLRLGQLFSIPLKNISYKIAGSEKVYSILDLPVRRNYTAIITNPKFDLSGLEEFDEKLNEIYPLLNVAIGVSVNDATLQGFYNK
jgi:hypothetical protein